MPTAWRPTRQLPMDLLPTAGAFARISPYYGVPYAAEEQVGWRQCPARLRSRREATLENDVGDQGASWAAGIRDRGCCLPSAMIGSQGTKVRSTLTLRGGRSVPLQLGAKAGVQNCRS